MSRTRTARLSRELLQRFNTLLPEKAPDLDMRQKWLRIELGRMVAYDLDAVCAIFAAGRHQEMRARLTWPGVQKTRVWEEDRIIVLANLTEWLRKARRHLREIRADETPVARQVDALLAALDPKHAVNALTTSWMRDPTKKFRSGPLGTPWIANTRRQLKALGIPFRHYDQLFRIIGWLPFSSKK